MRIIEPRDFRTQAPKSRKARHLPKVSKSRAILSIVLVLILGFGWLKLNKNQEQKQAEAEKKQSSVQTQVTDVSKEPPKLKNFTADEFKNLADSFEYPNTTTSDSPLAITESAEADAHIRALAEAKGYKLMRLAPVNLEKTEGFPLQQGVSGAWQEIKSAAAKENITLGLGAGYRSPDEQRLVFLQRLSAAEVSIDATIGNQADAAINTILNTTTIPGYSRHNTGYAISLNCNGQDVAGFAVSACYQWLNKNNFENAKKAGWIPSYPEGMTAGSPAEQAEFIFVGTAALTEKT